MSQEEQQEIRKLKKKLKKQELKNSEIRDEMAIQRTIFANERTLMAYMRTAIALIAGGFAAIKLSQHTYMELMGFVLMPMGVVLALYSFARYFGKQKLIKKQRQHFRSYQEQRDTLREKQLFDE